MIVLCRRMFSCVFIASASATGNRPDYYINQGTHAQGAGPRHQILHLWSIRAVVMHRQNSPGSISLQVFQCISHKSVNVVWWTTSHPWAKYHFPFPLQLNCISETNTHCLLWMSDELVSRAHLRKFLMYFNVFRWLVISKMLTEVLGSCLFSCSEIQNTNHEPVFWCNHCIHTCNIPVSQLLGRQYHCLLHYMASVDTEETSLCSFLSLNTSMSLKVVLTKKQKYHTPERPNFQARTINEKECDTQQQP